MKGLQIYYYITEDFAKCIIETRKKLIPELIKARNEGKFASIKYDELITRENSESLQGKETFKKRTLKYI